MLDLFGFEIQDVRVKFSENEVDEVFVKLFYEGFLLENLGSSLRNLKRLAGKPDISPARAEGWRDLIWVYGIDEPSPIPFDVACAMSMDADSESLRIGIAKEFKSELLLLEKFLSERIPPNKLNLVRRKLSKYISF